MQRPLVLALVLLTSGALAGCTFGDDAATSDGAPDEPAGPSFLFVLENQSPYTVRADLRALGPGDVLTSGNLTAPPTATVDARVPIQQNGTHELTVPYAFSGDGRGGSGEVAITFDTSTCPDTTRVVMRVTTENERVFANLASTCVA